jgi:hypothetical protein
MAIRTNNMSISALAYAVFKKERLVKKGLTLGSFYINRFNCEKN